MSTPILSMSARRRSTEGEHGADRLGLRLLDRARGLVGEAAHRLIGHDARGGDQRGRLRRDDVAESGCR